MPRAANPGRRNRRTSNNPRNADRAERRQNRQEAQQRRANARRGAQTRAQNRQRTERGDRGTTPWQNIRAPGQSTERGDRYRSSSSVRPRAGRPWAAEPQGRTESWRDIESRMYSQGARSVKFRTQVRENPTTGEKERQRVMTFRDKNGRTIVNTSVSERDFRRYAADSNATASRIRVAEVG